MDVTQLETALLNAVLNARDAMPGGGELTVATADCELDGRDAVCIIIKDTGSGIPATAMQRVFEPFFTTKEIGKGTGLGLSQIHGFAAQAGGRAEIESNEGEGTTLRIHLPRTDKPASGGGPSRPSVCEIAGAGSKILLVDTMTNWRASLRAVEYFTAKSRPPDIVCKRCPARSGELRSSLFAMLSCLGYGRLELPSGRDGGGRDLICSLLAGDRLQRGIVCATGRRSSPFLQAL